MRGRNLRHLSLSYIMLKAVLGKEYENNIMETRRSKLRKRKVYKI